MKNIKGGYAVKNGYYIKNDCKNNEADGSVDEEGYILDPLTYERILEGNIIQLSDGICYNKSKDLAKNIRRRNSLPFGHPLTVMDQAQFSSPTPSQSYSLSSFPVSTGPSQISSISPIQISTSSPQRQLDEHEIAEADEFVNMVENEGGLDTYFDRLLQNPTRYTRRQPRSSPRTTRRGRQRLIIDSSSTPQEIHITPEEVIEIVPRNTRRTVRRRLPENIIIDSASTEVIGTPEPEEIRIASTEAQVSPVPTPRRRGRPPGSRNRNTRGNTGRGIKYKTKKHKKR